MAERGTTALDKWGKIGALIAGLFLTITQGIQLKKSDSYDKMVEQVEEISSDMKMIKYQNSEHKEAHTAIEKRLDKISDRVEAVERGQYTFRQGRPNYSNNNN